MKTDVLNTECRELTDAELNVASGGLKGAIEGVCTGGGGGGSLSDLGAKLQIQLTEANNIFQRTL
jgi:hypothetical protein